MSDPAAAMLSEPELAAEIVTTGGDLWDEWFPSSLDRYGVRREIANIWGLVHPVRGFLERGAFTPAADGRKLWACPVRIGFEPDVDDPAGVIRRSPMIDVCAFDPHRPDEFGLRCGLADWLGAVEPQDFMPDPVQLHANPLAWLRARCHGLALLTRNDRTAQSVLVSLRRVVVRDIEFGKRLKRIAVLPLPGPEILVALEQSEERVT